MQQIQIPRGYLGARLSKGLPLLQGELFHDIQSNEIYIGTGSTSETNRAVKIGGEGALSFIDEVSELPVRPILNGVYYITADIGNSKIGQIEVGEYHTGDLAIAVATTGTELSSGTTSGGQAVAFKWLRVRTGGGDASVTEFDASYTNFAILKDDEGHFVIKNIQEALVYVDRNKLSFGESLIFPTTVNEDNTEVANLTPSKTDLLNKVQPGYYYTIDRASTIDGVAYEVGDFLVVTSDVVSNDKELTADDLKFTRMASGTHDASKIYLNSDGTDLVRGNPTAATVYEEKDQETGNVRDALISLYTSKADLDPSTHKILLSEIPDTIVGGLDYQGTFNGGVDISGSSTTGTWRLPEADDKTSLDTDEGTTVQALVKGDYWVYTGQEHDISTLSNITSADGVLSKGDFIIYNGNNEWGVVDNVAPFTGVSASGNTLDQRTITLDGTVNFPNKTRGSVDEGNLTEEVTITANETSNSIEITTPSAILAKNNTFANPNAIYKETGDGLVVASGLTDDGETLTIQNTDRAITIVDETGEKTATIKAQNQLDTDGSSTTGSDKIEILLPKESGTLARREDLGMANGKADYVPAYNAEGSLVNSPIHVFTHNNKDDAIGFAYDVVYDADGSVKSDVKVIMPDATSTQVLPSVNGFLLNTQSIIDCGYWDDEGNVSFPNEGKYLSDGAKSTDELIDARNNTIRSSTDYTL